MKLALIAADIGNVNTKFRRTGGAWDLEPSLVRMAPATHSFRFQQDDACLRPLEYLDGPAGIDPGVPYLVGHDARRAGVADVATIGSAELRAHSPAYSILHLYALVASLPAQQTRLSLAFAGGLPVADSANPDVKAIMHQRLKGTHRLRWGDTTYELSIAKVALIPQPIGGIASLLFSPDGRILATGALARQRFALDIGGGTTDFTGRIGLDAIPGSEGGVRLGIQTAAEQALTLIQHRFPRLRHFDTARALELMEQDDPLIYIGGVPQSVAREVQTALKQTADAILAHVIPHWERRLSEGEVLIFGGGGQRMAEAISAVLSPLTTVTLLSHPLFRVVDGIERLAKHRLLE